MSISNVMPSNSNRLWAHCLLALALIVWIGFIMFIELKNYIKVRQAYLTSPQHRLRSSATTVLVRSIPPKWLSVEALENLYDVFPGGLRNIWINRNYDELSQLIEERDKIAVKLEAAETDLIKKCIKGHKEQIKKRRKQLKKSGEKLTDGAGDDCGPHVLQGHGLDVNNPHQIHHTVEDAVNDEYSDSLSEEQLEDERKPQFIGRGVDFITHGVTSVGRGVLGGVKQFGRFGQGHNQAKGDEEPVSPIETRPPQAIGNDVEDQYPLTEPLDSPATKTTITLDGGEGEPSRISGIEGDDDGEKPNRRKAKTFKSPAYDEAFDNDKGLEPAWQKYIKESDRDSMRMPIFGWKWMISLPWMGQKVDTIYHCRRELARLNSEIEKAQSEPEKFPLMNSAFIQFNNQAAAHMACQSVSHHIPKQMAPRLVEISPKDVIWDNMSLPWWQQYVRQGFVLLCVGGMVILWAIPVAFAGSLSQIDTVKQFLPFLADWLGNAPPYVISIIQGLLPPIIIGILVALLPIILRFLARLQGIPTEALVELAVQKYYFAFQFVQVFIVVTIASAITTMVGFINQAANGGTFDVNIVTAILARNIPTASNYFLSYLLLQGLSVSASALLQVVNLILFYIMGGLFDNTARAKFKRQTELQTIKWGTFFPVYTNLACIGIIYSVIAPLILVFNIITFALFWFVYRYNAIYVNQFRNDTGGLLFPTAVKQLFTGVYVLELLLIGYFGIVSGTSSGTLVGQLIVMALTLLGTILFQFLLNEAFGPLFQYLPITLEDDAVARDEEFARLLERRHAPEEESAALAGGNGNIEDLVDERERLSEEEDQQHEKQKQVENGVVADDIEMKEVPHRHGTLHKLNPINLIPTSPRHKKNTWASRDRRRSTNFGKAERTVSESPHPRSTSRSPHPNRRNRSGTKPLGLPIPIDIHRPNLAPLDPLANVFVPRAEDVEAQRNERNKLNEALFAGISDELEDLTQEQRDVLVQRAFLHSALRAKRPVIWLPRDDLGVSDDELRNISYFSKWIWGVNRKQGFDEKGRCTFESAPPDFDEVDLIRL